MPEEPPLKAIPWLTRGRLRLVLGICGFWTAYELLAFLLTSGAALVVWWKKSTLALPYYTLLACIGSLAATWLFLAMERKPLASVGYGFGRRWLRDLGLGFLGGGLLILGIALTAHASGGFFWIRRPEASVLHAFPALALFAMGALHEETLFRGYAFQRLRNLAGFWPAQGLFALCFALAHWGNPGLASTFHSLPACNLILAAMALGLCYGRTNSLALPIGAHLGWNWVQGSWLGFPVSGLAFPAVFTPVFQGGHPWLTGGAFGLEGSLISTGALGAAVILLTLWRKKPSDKGILWIS